MHRSFSESLQDIIKYSEECQGLLEGKSLLAFSNDQRLVRAVERLLQIVGEALWQCSKNQAAFSQHISNTRKIIGLRHRLVHDYARIAHAVLWSAVAEHLPGLKSEAENLLVLIEAGEELDD